MKMGIENLLEKAQNFEIPAKTPRLNITVVGAGGAGNNTVTRLNMMGLRTAKTIAINTDAAHLTGVKAEKKILIGKQQTRGLGAGGDPAVGERAAEYSYDEIEDAVENPDIAFIVAGMGGGTGTGSAPIVAEIAKKSGAITIAMVTRPFSVENGRSAKAKEGIRRLKEVADTVIVLENDRLLEIVPRLPINQAFMVMDVLIADVIKSLTEILTETSMINIDFADFRRVMSEEGDATILYGESAISEPSMVVEDTFNNHFMDVDCTNAGAALIHLTVGSQIPLETINTVMKGLTRDMAPDANVIMGIRENPEYDGKIKVQMVVTGIKSDLSPYMIGKGIAEPFSGITSR